ncbi:MAG TPA: hypothetical protein PKE03_10230 [Bacteroidales bacterium]|jgi:hypothetical protein|nr:hypothetical protein [Bacteroidales bacterium]
MVLLSNLHKMLERGTFSISFVAEDGRIITMNNVILTSWHSKGRTINVKSLTSKEIRTIRRCTIVRYNDEEVCL